jgi:hypothetical protein
MTACAYCGFEAYNVIEVRYARTIKVAMGSPGAARADEEQAPREILGRGYYVCDGCLCLLDFWTEHHLDPKTHSIYNILSLVYNLLVVWSGLAVVSLAGTTILLRDARFLSVGLVLALASLVTWFIRAGVHSRYYGGWRETRKKALVPKNSLGGLTNLRDRRSRELKSYLPIRFADSLNEIAKPGSPPLRCLGPNAEPWGLGPPTNFEGRGDNDYYRLVWISARLWPLTRVNSPGVPNWEPPPQPMVSEVEVAVSTLSGAVAALLVVGAGQAAWIGVAAGLVLAPVGYLAGKTGRLKWEKRQAERYSGSAIAPSV